VVQLLTLKSKARKKFEIDVIYKTHARQTEMPVRYDPLIVDSSAQHVLHVYVSACPCPSPRRPLPTSGAMYTPEPGGLLVASANQVNLLDMYMQQNNMSVEQAAYLLHEEYLNYKPYRHTFGDREYEVGIRDGRDSDRAEFYIKNCFTGTVRLLEVVLKEIAASGVSGDGRRHDRRGSTHGASAGRGSRGIHCAFNSGRGGAAAPRGGGGDTLSHQAAAVAAGDPEALFDAYGFHSRVTTPRQHPHYSGVAAAGGGGHTSRTQRERAAAAGGGGHTSRTQREGAAAAGGGDKTSRHSDNSRRGDTSRRGDASRTQHAGAAAAGAGRSGGGYCVPLHSR